MIDIFFHSVNHPLPQWPQIQLLSEGDQVRSRYIEAMNAADNEDYRELLAFMKEGGVETKMSTPAGNIVKIKKSPARSRDLAT